MSGMIFVFTFPLKDISSESSLPSKTFPFKVASLVTVKLVVTSNFPVIFIPSESVSNLFSADPTPWYISTGPVLSLLLISKGKLSVSRLSFTEKIDFKSPSIFNSISDCWFPTVLSIPESIVRKALPVFLITCPPIMVEPLDTKIPSLKVLNIWVQYHQTLKN